MTLPTQQQQQQTQQPGGNLDSRIGILESGFAGFSARLESIDRKLDTHGKIPWGALIGSAIGAAGLMVTLITAIGTLAFTPLSTGIADTKLGIAKLESRSERYVPREDLDNRFAVIAQRRDDLQRLSDARTERTERDVEAIAKQVVPRGEHEQTWAAQRVTDAALQRQVDVLSGRLGDLNSPRDTIQAILRRLDELDRVVRPVAPR